MENLKILAISDAARIIGKGEDWLRQKIRKGEGPPAFRISKHRIGILDRELQQWIDSLIVESRPSLTE